MTKITSNSRWLYLIVGAITLLFIGFIYGWSILSVPLQQGFGWTASDVAIIFSVSMAIFTAGGLVGALLTKRTSHRLTMSLAAFLLCLSYTLSSTVNSDGLVTMALTYGLMGGIATGMAHNTILSTVNKWFPERAGTSSGLLSCAMGFGTLVIGPVAHWLIDSYGWRATFITIGVMAGVMILLASWLIKANPNIALNKEENSSNAHAHQKNQVAHPNVPTSPTVDSSTTHMIKLKPFWLTFAWSVIVSAIYLGTMGSAKQIALEAGAVSELATAMVGFIAIFDGCARFASGLFYDKLGYRKSMLTVSLLFVASPTCLYISTLTDNIAFVFVGFAFLGMAFGSVSTVLAALTIKFYGMKNYGNNLAVVYMDFLPASVIGPPIAGLMSTNFGSFEWGFAIFMVYGLIAVVLSRLVKPPTAAISPQP